MQVQVKRDSLCDVDTDAVVIPITASESLPRALRELDDAAGGALSRYFEAGDFAGKAGQTVQLPVGGIAAKRVVLVGLGPAREVDAEALRVAAAAGVRAAHGRRAQSAAIALPSLRRPATSEIAFALTEGALLGLYRFDKYMTLEPKKPALERLVLLVSDARQQGPVRRAAQTAEAICEAACFARDLSNEPGSVATPEALARAARELAKRPNLKCTVLGEAQLKREKMGGILAVGAGSAHPPRLIVLEYGKPGPRRPTIALVGKGITFDTGGISIKPGAQMDEMKHDMSGGAAVLGTLRAAADLKLPFHLIGIVPAAQNSPDGAAYLPGDVVTTSSGRTIEVLNTDAEGRIVLADGLHYAGRYEPDAVIDLATLTGACVIALGAETCAAMGDEKLTEKLRDAGARTHERVWPMPLWKEHREAVKSKIADVRNTAGREAGTSTAGAFLSYFAPEGVPWVHLDIAGTAWSTADAAAYRPRGASGFGVRLLVDLLRNWK